MKTDVDQAFSQKRNALLSMINMENISNTLAPAGILNKAKSLNKPIKINKPNTMISIMAALR